MDVMKAPGAACAAILEQWWVLVVRGVLAIGFAMMALLWPQLTWLVFLSLFAALAVLDGIASMAGAVRTRDWGWRFWSGVLSLALGVLVVASPRAGTLALLVWIGAWAVARGIFDFIAAWHLRARVRNVWLLFASGAASIAFGMLLALRPLAGIVAIVTLVAIFAGLTGGLLIAAGLWARHAQRTAATGPFIRAAHT